MGAGFVTLAVGAWLLLRQQKVRAAIMETLGRMPLLSKVLSYQRTAVFCRNLGVLLTAGVTLTATLRILADMMATTGRSKAWGQTVDIVRQGGKLSDALSETQALPPMAIRTLRLGEESGQLPMLAERIAGYYEVKLQRSLDKLVGVIGPLAIISISVIVGGLIVSIMTALMSVSQVVG
ncbi:Type II secretion system protein (fragment) [Methylocella tundrae]